MKRNQQVKHLAISGLLTAVGILIPVFMPFKVMLPSSTYTLASHVPVFIGMFISPQVAIMVALGTTFGFFLSFPPIVAARAFSHLSFAIPGALYLKKHKLDSTKHKVLFNLVIALIHALGEFTVVSLLHIRGMNGQLLLNFFIFLGLGTIVHSVVDFVIALTVVDGLNLQNN